MGKTDTFQPFLGWLFSSLLLPLWAAVSRRHLQFCCGSKAWAESKRLAKLSWEFGDSFHQFTALGIRWLPPCLITGWWAFPAHPGVRAWFHGLPADAHSNATQPHPVSVCASGFYAESSDYLPKTNRIQDRDGLGLCSLIKLKQYLTQTLS